MATAANVAVAGRSSTGVLLVLITVLNAVLLLGLWELGKLIARRRGAPAAGS